VSISDKDKVRKTKQDAFRVSQTVLALIEEHHTPPTPEAYAFWYAYVTQADEALVKTVNKMIERGEEFGPYEIEELSKDALPEDDAAVQQERIGKAFSRKMTDVVDLVSSGVSNNDRFQEQLASIGQELPEQGSEADIREILDRLIEENRLMAERSRSLQSGLKTSQAQIAKLSTELDDVRKQSTRDPLTGVANRRALNAHLGQSIEAAIKSGESLCLVMADIDHFKTVNDTFGHPVGDDVLKVFANLIRKNVKGRDMVARYGGEEFSIVLPKTPPQAALKLIDGIREQFASKRLMVRQSREKVGQITASFGIAAFESGLTPGALIEKADVQLYRAKRTGRNQVCMTEISDETISAGQ
ncbi:MAG: GGDEF domain-containing protein, partial [Henriciella sp.]|uniref:GGDEF domain-containing protein n=1 Tax=Henriciella sp. TaxID=1968823 RepID=UPI003C74B7F9